MTGVSKAASDLRAAALTAAEELERLECQRREAEESPADTDMTPLNFRVPTDFKRRFRLYAAKHDMKLTEVLKLAFDRLEGR